MNKDANWIQWKYLQELSDADKARLVNVDGEWNCFKDQPELKFFIKKLDNMLVICEEYLEKKD